MSCRFDAALVARDLVVALRLTRAAEDVGRAVAVEGVVARGACELSVAGHAYRVRIGESFAAVGGTVARVDALARGGVVVWERDRFA